MPVAFGVKSTRCAAAPAAAFGAEELDDTEPGMSSAAAEAEAKRLQAMGNACAASGDLSAALAAWTQAIALVPPSSTGALAVLHEQSAQVLLEQGRTFEAVQSAERATHLRNDWPEAFLTLGRAQVHFGEPELALQSLEAVLQLQPGNAEASVELSEVRKLVLQRGQGGGLQRRVIITSGGHPAHG